MLPTYVRPDRVNFRLSEQDGKAHIGTNVDPFMLQIPFIFAGAFDIAGPPVGPVGPPPSPSQQAQQCSSAHGSLVTAYGCPLQPPSPFPPSLSSSLSRSLSRSPPSRYECLPLSPGCYVHPQLCVHMFTWTWFVGGKWCAPLRRCVPGFVWGWTGCREVALA
jgi:hypothetical protein